MKAATIFCIVLLLAIVIEARIQYKGTQAARSPKAVLRRRARNEEQKKLIDEDLRKAYRFRDAQAKGLKVEKTSTSEQSEIINIGASNCVTPNVFSTLGATHASAALKAKVETWKARGGDCVWKGITRANVGATILSRFAKPHEVDQRNAGFCAPACVMFWVSIRKPQLWAEFTMAMCDSGTFTTGDYEIEVDSDLRDFGPGTSNFKSMAHADWMDMSALRDKENDWYDVNADASDKALGGDVYAGDVEDWFDAFFPEKNVEEFSSRSWGDSESFGEATRAVAAGGCACMIVDAKIVQGASNFDVDDAVANHWVAYAGGYRLDADETMHFNVWTWAQECPVTLKWSHFTEMLFATMVVK